MATGVKEIRCGARRSENTCKATNGVCDWDAVAQVCKKTTNGKQQAIGQQKTTNVAATTKANTSKKQKQDCNLKTKVACVKREHCQWDSGSKTCNDKPKNQAAVVMNDTLNNTTTTLITTAQNTKTPIISTQNQANTRLISQGEIVMKGVQDAIDAVIAMSAVKKYPIEQVKVNINSGTYDFDVFSTKSVALNTPTTYTSENCKIAKVVIQGVHSFKTRVNGPELRQITDNVNAQLAKVNNFTNVMIEVKPLSLREIHVIIKAFFKIKETIRCYVKTNDKKTKKRTKKAIDSQYNYNDDNTIMGFFAYDGCHNPNVMSQTILGHTIYNIPKDLAGFSEFLLESNMKMYTPASCEKLQHQYKPNWNVVEMYRLDGNSESLNVSMMMYMQEAEALDSSMVNRILALLKEFQKIQNSSNLHGKPFVVYHGTTQAIHHTKRFVTGTFLSTSTSFSTAYEYSGASSGTVYVIEVPGNFPFINYCTILSQILLPPGTSIVIDKAIFIKSTRYVLCRVESANVDLNSFIQIFENPCNRTTTIEFRKSSRNSPLLVKELSNCNKTTRTGSSSFYSCTFNNSKYIVKDIVKKSNKAKLLTKDHHVFIRILNELLASVIYREVYGLSTLELQLVDKRNVVPDIDTTSNFLLASKNLDGIKYNGFSASQRKLLFNGFFVDCILGNWDVFNNLNIGLYDDNVIRTDVGGCMAFRGKGDFNIAYDINMAPRDHISILQQRSVKQTKPRPNTIEGSLRYLESITDVADRLRRVRQMFEDMLTSLTLETQRVKYMKFVDKLIKVVQYRDNWYRNNGAMAINAMFNQERISDNTDLNLKNLNTKNEGVSQSPIAFVMSPAKLNSTLVKLKQCTM